MQNYHVRGTFYYLAQDIDPDVVPPPYDVHQDYVTMQVEAVSEDMAWWKALELLHAQGYYSAWFDESDGPDEIVLVGTVPEDQQMRRAGAPELPLVELED